MIKCIIIEDDLASLEIIKREVSYYKEFSIVGYASSVKEANVLLENTTPDLCISDIKLGDGDIFDVLSNIKEIFFNIIFITAYEEYALKAIKFSALDYILKPLDLNELHSVLRNYINLSNNATFNLRVNNLQNLYNHKAKFDKIIIPTKEEYKIFNISDIEYCESEGCYTIFHFSDKSKVVSSKPIGLYEDLFTELNFFRIHQKYLVNASHIKSLLKGNPLHIKLYSGDILQVSRLKKADFLKFFLH